MKAGVQLLELIAWVVDGACLKVMSTKHMRKPCAACADLDKGWPGDCAGTMQSGRAGAGCVASITWLDGWRGEDTGT